MPYRIDLTSPPEDALDRLVTLGALDVEQTVDGVAALIPDGVDAERVQMALGTGTVRVAPAPARDGGSSWVLAPRPMTLGPLSIVPAHIASPPSTLKLIDSPIFGSGLHLTTALCVEALGVLLGTEIPPTMLDIGTGSGVLALGALLLGVRRAAALDVDPDALVVAAENARLNNLVDRLELVFGGPETVNGTWPLVVANIVAAPLIEMAPAVVRRVGHRGKLVLSGMTASLAPDVERTYRRLGMRHVRTESRAGWSALVLAPTW